MEWRFGFAIRTGDVDSFAHSPNAPFGFFGGIPPQLSAEAPLFLMPFRLAAGHRVFFDLEDLRDFGGTGGRLTLAPGGGASGIAVPQRAEPQERPAGKLERPRNTFGPGLRGGVSVSERNPH